jgi:DNA-binding transcriptional LysR family regulator
MLLLRRHQSTQMGKTVAVSETIDLNDVAVFVKVIEAGGFSRAAEQLALTKSAVSRRVARLEEALGARLLHRTTRRSSPTEAGTRFHQRAIVALAELSDATTEIDELALEPRGRVRITAPPDLGSEYLAPLIARFTRRHPRIEIELCLSTRFVDLVAEGFDFALRGGVLQDSSLVARRIATTPLVAIASSRYLAKHGTPREPEDLCAHECILFGAEQGRARWTLVGPSGERTVSVTGRVRTDDLAFVRALTLQGAGIALLPLVGAKPAITRGPLVRLLPGWHGPAGALYLLSPSARHVRQAVQLLREYLYVELKRALSHE